MNFFTANPIDKLFSLLSLSHFTEFYYHEGAVMSRDRLFALQEYHQGEQRKDSPKVHAFVSQDMHNSKNTINISFMVEKVDGLSFADFNESNISKANNLWQETCLECFISLADERYLEINVAPDGRYAIYEFNSYRMPSTPVPSDKITLSWRADDNDNVLVYERHFSLDISTIADLLDPVLCDTLLNLSAILVIDGQPHYFATHHGNKPDFHDKDHWQRW